MKKVVLFGVGQVASRAYYHFTHDSEYEVAAFTVDAAFIQQDRLFDLPVVPFEEVESAYPPSDYAMFLSISSQQVNRLRARKYEEAKAKGYPLVNYISARAMTWPDLSIGDNCRVQAHTVIEPFAEIGNNVGIGVGNLISHNAVVKAHCTVTHHATILGNAVIEPYCFIGAGAIIRDNVTVAPECVIGAGALILKDTEPKGVYRGNPAVLLSKRSDELKTI